MAREFQAGDDLLFQLESGYGLIRVLGIDEGDDGEIVWHLLAYSDLFPDGDSAESMLKEPETLSVSIAHMALTNRAFERTPTAKLLNREISESEAQIVAEWRKNEDRKISDRFYVGFTMNAARSSALISRSFFP